MLSYTHFTLDERKYLQQLLAEGKSFREIARILERSPSTISREVKRNRAKHKPHKKPDNKYWYNYWRAQNLYIRRRRDRLPKAILPGTRKWDFILDGFGCCWSPETIAGRWHSLFPNRAWDALSPDSFLNPYKVDYQWLSRVYESVKPTDGRGGLIWASLGAKTIELVHQNVTVGEADEDMDILSMDADLIDDFLEKQKDLKKTTKKVEINLVAKILKHANEPKFVHLGEKLEALREKHEQGLITSIEFLKLLLELAKEAAQAAKEVVPEQEIDKGIAALTELFNGIKNKSTPVIVERIVADIDSIVKIVRFDGWQSTTAGKQEVKKALRSVVWIKYKIKDKEVFDKAYNYIEQYY